MSSADKRIPAPRGMGTGGRKLWRDITAEYGLTVADLAILTQACRTTDELDRLGAAAAKAPVLTKGSTGQEIVHPVHKEMREHRAILAKLLDTLRLPSTEPSAPESHTTQAARHAANVRWRAS